MDNTSQLPVVVAYILMDKLRGIRDKLRSTQASLSDAANAISDLDLPAAVQTLHQEAAETRINMDRKLTKAGIKTGDDGKLVRDKAGKLVHRAHKRYSSIKTVFDEARNGARSIDQLQSYVEDTMKIMLTTMDGCLDAVVSLKQDVHELLPASTKTDENVLEPVKTLVNVDILELVDVMMELTQEPSLPRSGDDVRQALLRIVGKDILDAAEMSIRMGNHNG